MAAEDYIGDRLIRALVDYHKKKYRSLFYKKFVRGVAIKLFAVSLILFIIIVFCAKFNVILDIDGSLAGFVILLILLAVLAAIYTLYDVISTFVNYDYDSLMKFYASEHLKAIILGNSGKDSTNLNVGFKLEDIYSDLHNGRDSQCNEANRHEHFKSMKASFIQKKVKGDPNVEVCTSDYSGNGNVSSRIESVDKAITMIKIKFRTGLNKKKQGDFCVSRIMDIYLDELIQDKKLLVACFYHSLLELFGKSCISQEPQSSDPATESRSCAEVLMLPLGYYMAAQDIPYRCSSFLPVIDVIDGGAIDGGAIDGDAIDDCALQYKKIVDVAMGLYYKKLHCPSFKLSKYDEKEVRVIIAEETKYNTRDDNVVFRESVVNQGGVVLPKVFGVSDRRTVHYCNFE